MKPEPKKGTTRRLGGLAVACAMAIATSACGTTGIPSGDDASALSVAVQGDTQAALRQRLLSGSAPEPVASFYKARDFRPLWTGSGEAQARAALVILTLEHADRQGLRSADYRVAMPSAAAPLKPGPAAAEYDVALTRALFRYAHDVSIGRIDPSSVYKDVDLPRRSFNVGQALSEMLGDGDGVARFIAELPPPHPQYRRLVAALAKYRAIEKKGGWHHLARGASRAGLVERLAVEDPELAAISDPSAADVKAAVLRFQARHGLDTDGHLGPATLRALNVPVSRRIKVIAANMERWRWLPRRFEPMTIQVNVPEQIVDFVKDGKVELESKVVVGRRSMPTPILRTAVDAVIANPAWDIPDDIAAKSILPHLRHNADYLKSRNMALVDAPDGVKVDWSKVKGDVLPYQIQQLPGPHNGLGQLMIDMPNKYYVYLHGTPNQSLFARDDREISHGCVRVEKIGSLAALALSGSADDAGRTVKDAIATGQTERLPLSEPLPVYLLYWTARAGENGAVAFPQDRYDRDPRLIARLAQKAHRPTRPRPRPAVQKTLADLD